MKAMAVREQRAIDEQPISEVELPDPSPGRGEILLRVEACAICRTDLQLAEGDIEARRLPFVPGHQIVGIVEALGRDAKGWEIGQRAGVAWLAGTCGVCDFCVTGRENLCPEARFTGWDRGGGFAEKVTVESDFAFALASDADTASLAPLLCGGVIGYRSLKRSGVRPGGRLGLFGYGASAHLALQLARHWDCEVYVFTRSEREQQRALATGAAWAGGYDEQPGVLLDAAVTFAPVGDIVVAALRAVNRGGVVAINAIHLDRIPQFSYDLLWWERELRSVANFTREDAREFLDLAVRIPIRTDISTLPLSDANLALGQLKAGKLPGTGVLIP